MQNQNKEYSIPKSFLREPFFNGRKSFNKLNFELPDILNKEPFYFDMLFSAGERDVNHKYPWESQENSLEIVFQLRKEILSNITREYSEKKRYDNEAILKCLSLLIAGLYWANSKPVTSLDPMVLGNSSITLKPINCQERLLFVVENRTKYHAFIQLQQLFDELEKIYYKNLAIKKAKSKT